LLELLIAIGLPIVWLATESFTPFAWQLEPVGVFVIAAGFSLLLSASPFAGQPDAFFIWSLGLSS
jgi:hypothetical protein